MGESETAMAADTGARKRARGRKGWGTDLSSKAGSASSSSVVASMSTSITQSLRLPPTLSECSERRSGTGDTRPPARGEGHREGGGQGGGCQRDHPDAPGECVEPAVWPPSESSKEISRRGSPASSAKYFGSSDLIMRPGEAFRVGSQHSHGLGSAVGRSLNAPARIQWTSLDVVWD